MFKILEMDLKKHIKENYGSQRKFANKHGIKEATVSYWCKTDWKRLSYSVKEKICNFIDVELI